MLAFLETRRATQLALVANLIGVVMIAAALSATSPDFRLVTSTEAGVTSYELCTDKFVMTHTDTSGNLIISSGPCRTAAVTAAPIVLTRSAVLLRTGLVLVILGLAGQFLVACRAP